MHIMNLHVVETAKITVDSEMGEYAKNCYNKALANVKFIPTNEVTNEDIARGSFDMYFENTKKDIKNLNVYYTNQRNGLTWIINKDGITII